jgi:hypothetical protein
MEKALEDLSAAKLRHLLIEEVKKFTTALDHTSSVELEAMKYRLRKIFDLIAEKEKAESKPLPWGNNSTKKS